PGMRSGDVDRIHLGIGEQRVVAIMDARAGEIGLERSLGGIARPDSDEVAAVGAVEAAQECLGNSARANDAPANGFVPARHFPMPPSARTRTPAESGKYLLMWIAEAGRPHNGRVAAAPTNPPRSEIRFGGSDRARH